MLVIPCLLLLSDAMPCLPTLLPLYDPSGGALTPLPTLP